MKKEHGHLTTMVTVYYKPFRFSPRWTPLPDGSHFKPIKEFHRLDFAHAGQTPKDAVAKRCLLAFGLI
ncbi:hypothetical protein [Sporomusa termitida]|uniref:hypothetical protein n=1 Tax=Sporomusa termitida TaxID=2377 RepID=UPI00147936EB|nr:hypothetical protein [Sporomusa termitida]